MNESQYSKIEAAAYSGERITFTPEGADKPKTIWAGLGNRAGLHSYADTLTREKWGKSGERFMRKVRKLPSGTLCIQEYVASNRSRGKWFSTTVWQVAEARV